MFDIFNADLSQYEMAKDYGPAKVPAIAHVRITEVELTQSSKGNPQLVVNLEITNADALEPIDPNTKISTYLTKYVSLTEKALPFFKRFLVAFNIDWDTVKGNRDFAVLKGAEADVRLGTNDTQTRNEVVGYVVSSHSSV